MTYDDDEDQPDNLGSIGEQDSAPTDMPRVASPDEAWPPPVPITPPLPGPAEIPGAPPGMVTRKVTMSPEETATLGALDANTQARKNTVEEAGNLAVDKATDQAAQLQAEADLKEQQRLQQAELSKQQQAHIDELHRRDQTEYDKYRGMGLKDPDAHASFGHRLGAALAIGLGQYSAAMTGTENRAAQIFQQARHDNMALQKDEIERQKDASIRAGADAKQAEAEAAQKLHDLQTKQVAQIDAFKAKFQAESARMGIPAARIQATQTMQELDRQALEAREKHLESTRTVSRDLTPKEKRAGKGGGGGGAGVSELVRMKEAGATDGDIAARAEQLHIAPKAYLPSIANVDKTSGAAERTDQRVVMMDGKPVGLAPSARQTNDIQKRAVQYQDALESARALKERLKANPLLGRIPTGSDYDRAVLAVAATTQANASDKTTTHEAGTLKNYGMISEKGIDDTIAHLERRQQAFLGQLQPLPTKGAAARGLAPTGEAPASAPAGKSDADRAKALIASPAFSGFSSAKKAYLNRIARGAAP